MHSPPLLWYQQGFWPLIGAALILVIPNAVALIGIFAQTWRQTQAQIKLKRIDVISQQLSEFYNPMFAMLAINHDCFMRLGPSTFSLDPIQRESAGNTWNQIKQKVILPNNKEMANILRVRSHLIALNDSIDFYLQLNNHINMYEIFVDSPTELYKQYMFPDGVADHIRIMRAQLLVELQGLKGEKK